MMTTALHLIMAATALAGTHDRAADGARSEVVPVIDGAWWQVAGDPDLGPYTRAEQQPVDFAVWQAADGTWQLWACIRQTGCGGMTRLFHAWEGGALTSPLWQPRGIAMEADPRYGETPGGLQAPHVVNVGDRYVMAYGDWENICFATSQDGKKFERVVRQNGKTSAFSEGAGFNTRDPMLLRIGSLWHCYYTACVRGQGYVFCRTSADLRTWGDSCVVSYGGVVGTSPWHSECPFVVEVQPGSFVLFRNQFYGEGARNWQYASANPLNFGVQDDVGLVRCLDVAAPEIILYEGQYYIAALMPNLKGIRIARLRWEVRPAFGKPLLDLEREEVRRAWRVTQGDLAAPFAAGPQGWILTTGHAREGAQAATAVIESPPFRIEQDTCLLSIAGGSNSDEKYVALVDAKSGEESARASGRGHDTLEHVRMDASRLKGKEAIIRVVDRAPGAGGSISFGGVFEDPIW